jgi:hypothetical protein
MNNLNIKSVLKDVLAIIIITIIVMFVFVACKSQQPVEQCKCDNSYTINYLESSMIVKVDYDAMFKVVQNPREDLIIKDNCGELVFEFKD